MILAAVIPYHHPRGAGHGRVSSCIVRVADGGRVLAEEWIEVGHLAPVDGGDRLTRVVGPAQVAAVAAQAAAFMVKHAVQRARFEMPNGSGVEADRGRAIALAIVEALPGVPALNVGQAKGDLATRWAVLLKDEGSAAGETVEPSEGCPPHAALPAGIEPATLRQTGGHSHQNELREPAEPTPAPTFPQAPKAGRRIAGIDPGSRHIAVAVVEELGVESVGGGAEVPRGIACDAALLGGEDVANRASERGAGCDTEYERAQVTHAAQSTPGHTGPQPVARMVAWLPLTIGRDVPLDKPRVITRKDGATYTKTTRHEVTDDDVLQLLRDVAAFLAEHDVDAAVVESATHAHAGAGALLPRSQAICGEIAGWLRAAGLPVHRVASATWRASAKKRAGLRAQGGSDAGTKRNHAEPSGLRGSEVGPGPVREGAGTMAVGGGVGERTAQVQAEGLAEERPCAVRGAHGHGSWPAAVRALVTDLPTLPPDAREHVLDAAGAALMGIEPPPEPEPTKPRERVAKGARKRGAKPARDPGPKVPRVLSCKKCGGPRAGHVRGLPCPERGANGG